MSSLRDSIASFTQRLTQHIHRTIVQENAASDQALAATTPTWEQPTIRIPVRAAAEATFVAIDVSGSMDEAYRGAANKLAAAVAAAGSYIITKASTAPNDSIALGVFNDQASIVCPVGPICQTRGDLLRGLRQLTISGGTDLDAPLRCAESHLGPLGDFQRRVLLITDGHGGNPLATARRLQSIGFFIDVVGIGDTPAKVNEDLLRSMASVVDGQNRYVFIRDLQSLVRHTTAISQRIPLQGNGQ